MSAASSAKLPPGWVVLPSSSQPDKVYYYNTLSRVSSWTPPPSADLYKEPTTVRARHILVKHVGVKNPVSKNATNPGPVTRSLAEATEIAEKLLKEAQAAPESFENLAKLNSDCNSSARGGDLGKPFARGEMHAPFSDAAFALEVGQISGVIASPSGLHIVQRLE